MPSDKYQGQFAARQMLDKGLRRVVVAFSDGAYGQSLSFAFTAAFTKGGGAAYPVPVSGCSTHLLLGAQHVVACAVRPI